eukprot:gb/GECH01008115.1/.p1 GENE.gb/GECH01008115.1/~~gb/GECH01008115.1/.p1  ORF type:complete len:543 (+),score=117.55 gb/GECH01008115.1/:1-1629(+)
MVNDTNCICCQNIQKNPHKSHKEKSSIYYILKCGFNYLMVGKKTLYLCGSEWRYKAEGAINIVLEYIGNDSSLKGNILRLAKNVENISFDGQLENHLFVKHVMRPLLGYNFVEPGHIVNVDESFLKNISKSLSSVRPKYRSDVSLAIDTNTFGLICPDLSQLTDQIENTPSESFCVELKPKCGFICKSSFIDQSHLPHKHNVCRFCMHQYLKLKGGKEERISQYCPLDMYSGEPKRMKRALKRLIETPQNNLKLFHNGHIVWGDKKRLSKVEGLENNKYDQQLESILTKIGLSSNKNHDSLSTAHFVNLLVEILNDSGVLNQLLSVQRLDETDIAGIYRLHRHLSSDPKFSLRNPSLFSFFDESRADNSFLFNDDFEIPWLNDIQAQVEELQSSSYFPRCEGLRLKNDGKWSLCNENDCAQSFEAEMEQHTDLKDPQHLLSLPRSSQLRLIRQFLISQTAKDCSIMLTFRRLESQTAIKKTENATVLVDGITYEYRLRIVDLDPKDVERIPHYHDLDRSIVECFQHQSHLPEEIKTEVYDAI